MELKMGITILDWLVIALYGAVLLGIGIFYQKKVTTSEEFFLAGRTLGFFPIMCSVCASIIGTGALLGRGGLTYTRGAGAVMAAVPYFFGMLVFTSFAHRIQEIGQKNNVNSIAEFIGFRFGINAQRVASLMIAFGKLGGVSINIVGMATLLKFVTGTSYEMGAIIGAIVVIVYTSMAGLFAVAYTDVFQFLILVPIIYILLPVVGVNAVGGLSGLREILAPEMFEVSIDVAIIGIIFTNVMSSVTGAEFWQRSLAAKSGKEATKGLLYGNLVYGLTLPLSIFIGLSAAALFPNLIEAAGTADAAVPMLVTNLLSPGIAGLGIAGIFAVIMSSADTELLMATQGFSELLKDFFPSLYTDVDAELRINRIISVLVGLGGIVMALKIRGAYEILMAVWGFYTSALGVPAIVCLAWRKATTKGVMSGIAAGFLSNLMWSQLGTPWGISPAIPGCIMSGLVLWVVSIATYDASSPSRWPEVSPFTPFGLGQRKA